jgi:APA family basic amino acid/polyamine antiporter
MNPARPTEKSSLRRDLTFVDAVGIGLGAIIGAGIFVVTGAAAGVAGAAFLVGLVIAGIAATCNALSSAELAAKYPQSGGTYEYGYQLLHPFFGFSAGWMFLASKLAAGGVVALDFGSYFAQLGSSQ